MIDSALCVGRQFDPAVERDESQPRRGYQFRRRIAAVRRRADDVASRAAAEQVRTIGVERGAHDAAPPDGGASSQAAAASVLARAERVARAVLRDGAAALDAACDATVWLPNGERVAIRWRAAYGGVEIAIAAPPALAAALERSRGLLAERLARRGIPLRDYCIGRSGPFAGRVLRGWPR
jgi:hypothetical protein